MNEKIVKAEQAFNSGKVKQALSIVEKINKTKAKQTFASLEMQGSCLASLKQSARAKEAFLKALIKAPDDTTRAKIHYDLFTVSLSLKDFKDAQKNLEIAIPLASQKDSINWRLSQAAFYYQLRDYDKSEALCNKLIVYSQCTLICMNMLLDIAIAKTNLEKVDYYLRQFEGRLNELNGNEILSVYVKVEAFTTLDFSKSLEKAIARGADPLLVNIIRAAQLFRKGDEQGCNRLLEGVSPELIQDDDFRKRYFELKGKVSDKRGEFEEAIANFDQMNQIAKVQFDRNGGASTEVQQWSQFKSFSSTESEYKSPLRVCFLVGFPRSGTTLLENVLDSQKSILALPERPLLDDLIVKMTLDGVKYPQSLKDLSEEALNGLRDEFFSSALKYSGKSSFEGIDVLIDKNPINTIRIPFIKKLFPDAKIILAIRHPLDCILSCYMQNFGINRHLADFAELKGAFTRYKKTFELYEAFRGQLEWDEYSIKYEDLVSDFENEVESVLKYLGVTPDKEAFMGFNKRARDQVITTPSASQVRQGIYTSSTKRWLNYKEVVRPYVDSIRPHIDRLGYDVEEL